MSRTPPRHAPAPGSEHSWTQRVTLVCPEAGHRLGTIRGDVARAWIDPAHHAASGQECLALLPGGGHFAWLCWPCAHTGPGRCSGHLPATGVWALLARLETYGPAHVQVPALARVVSQAIPALPADCDHIAKRRDRLASAMQSEGEPLPATWAKPHATIADATRAP